MSREIAAMRTVLCQRRCISGRRDERPERHAAHLVVNASKRLQYIGLDITTAVDGRKNKATVVAHHRQRADTQNHINEPDRLQPLKEAPIARGIHSLGQFMC
jgi:hypothetical protein